MKHPIYKKHLRLTNVPKVNIRNGIKIWHKGKVKPYEKPTATCDIEAGKVKYFLPRKLYGKVYQVKITPPKEL